MGKLITASINVSKIDKKLLIAGKTGTFLNLTIWVNDEPDRFGNDVSLEQKTERGSDKIYLGNGKTYRPNQNAETPRAAGIPQPQMQQPPTPVDFGDKDDLPF